MASNAELTELLQAVVLLDAFNSSLLPFSKTKPSCLLPLANVPLLEYTLDFLARNGVQEVFLYAQEATSDHIDEYLQDSRWLKSSAPFKLQVVRSTGTSVGNAMRDIDARMKLNQHFLVIYGNVLGNFNIYQALEDHKTRRKADSNTMMTMLLRESQYPTKIAPTSPVFVNSVVNGKDGRLKPTSEYDGGRVLHYDERQLPGDESDDESCSDPEYDGSDDEEEEPTTPVLKKGRGVPIPDELVLEQSLDVRNDLVDCGVDICTPDVLAIWTDNPDFETHRIGFLQSTLKDYELNGKKIHSHIIKSSYLSPVRNLGEYKLATSDFLYRKAYPLCPDPGLLKEERYRGKTPQAIYIAKSGTSISSSAKLRPFCMVGSGTRIGKNCYIKDSIVGRDCKIGDGCILDGAYLWDGATVDAWTVISNSVIDYGVNITGKHRIVDLTVTGTDDEGNFLSGFEATVRAESSESLASKSAQPTKDTAGPPSPKPPASKSFVPEATSNIADGLHEGHDATTIHLELQAFRMAMNASEHEVRVAIGTALVQSLVREDTTVPEALSRLKTVLERSVFDTASDLKSDQIDFLLVVQRECCKLDTNGSDMLYKILYHLYDIDFDEEQFDDEAFLQWWEDARSQEDEEMRRVRTKTQKLIEMCASTGDSENSDDGEEEEEEDE